MHISVPKFNSLLKFQLHGIVSFSRFASSFPQIVKYDVARKDCNNFRLQVHV